MRLLLSLFDVSAYKVACDVAAVATSDGRQKHEGGFLFRRSRYAAVTQYSMHKALRDRNNDRM